MSRAKRSAADRGLWRGFRRPVRNDKAFWVAVVLCVLLFATQTGAAAGFGFGRGYVVAIVLADLLAVVVVFSIVGAIAGSIRGFGEGFRGDRRPSSDRPSAADDSQPAPPTAADPTPAGGRPKSVAELTESAKTMAGNVRMPTSADVDKGARTLGRAIGAAKRAARQPPPE